MKLSDNSLEDKHSEAQPNVSSNRNVALNPEASVFKLSTKSKDGEHDKESDEVHPFMNGDVGKQSCGDHNPMSESFGDNESTQNIVVEQTIEMSSEMEPVGESSIESMTETESVEVVAFDGETGNQMTKSQDSINGEPVSDARTISGNELQTQPEYIGNDDTGQISSSETLLKVANPEAGDDAATLTREDIKDLVNQQVEYFFSRENWSADRYLLSQMDSDQYVPVYILANCSQFKNVTKDHSIILDALKESSFVQLDEENNRVRPNYQRCIVILREIPQATPVDEIQAMFPGEVCPKAISCEFIHNDVWYVTFESDGDAQKAYRYLRETVKTFNDKPILARIKTKPASKSNCFSVLPSYGGKPPGEQQRETIPISTATGSTPAPLGPMGPSSNMPGVPNPPTPYTTNPRVFYPQNNINPYNYSNPQVPTAYFYPNPMIPWTQPGFYDFSQFMQYNGLSPRAAFKPANNSRYNNNANNVTNSNNRRNKNNNRESKVEPRNNGGGSSNRPVSRPPSAASLTNSHLIGPPNVDHSVERGSGCSTPNNSLMGTNFAQADLALASHVFPLPLNTPPSILSGRHSPIVPCSNSNPGASSEALEETTAGSSLVINNVPPPPSQPTTAQSPAFTHPSSQGQPIQLHSTISHRNSFNSEPHSNNAPARESQSQRANLSRGGNRRRTSRREEEPNSHSSGNNGNGRGSSRNSNQNQEVQAKTHGEARKTHFELQATSFPPLPTAEEVAAAVISEEKSPEPSSQTAWSMDTHKFSDVMKGTVKQKPNAGNNNITTEKEAQETVVPVVVTSVPEAISTKVVATTSSSTKTTSVSSSIKTTSSTISSVKSGPPTTSTNARVSLPIVSSVVKTVQLSSNSARSVPSNISSNSIVPPVSSSNTKTAVASIVSSRKVSPSPCSTSTVTKPAQTCSSIATSQSVSCSNSSSSHDIAVVTSTTTTASKSITEVSSSFRHDKGVVNRDPRPVREDRRSMGPAVRDDRRSAVASSVREDRRSVAPQTRDDRRPVASRREFISGIGRGNPRREGNFRLSGNKENRPQQKSWKEQRPDDEGWITKGARETRNNRDHRSSTHSFYENKNISKSAHPMVNGDTSAPPSPKAETENKQTTITNIVNKVATNNSKNAISSTVDKSLNKEETVTENDKSLNNNEGEHKTSWAHVAMASKDQMERLSTELKEKEEHERLKKSRFVRPISKLSNDRPIAGRERENKQFKPSFPAKDLPDRPPREFRGPPDNRNAVTYRQRDSMRSKSPNGK